MQLAESQSKLEIERSKLETIRADHTKQDKLHHKQIHDLRDKLSQFEVRFDTMNIKITRSTYCIPLSIKHSSTLAL